MSAKPRLNLRLSGSIFMYQFQDSYFRIAIKSYWVNRPTNSTTDKQLRSRCGYKTTGIFLVFHWKHRGAKKGNYNLSTVRVAA